MMTEEAAKQRWCPLVRFKSAETGSGPAFNRQRVSSDMDDVNCIGSRCMAWIWENRRPSNATSGEQFKGYCGAFGGRSHESP